MYTSGNCALCVTLIQAFIIHQQLLQEKYVLILVLQFIIVLTFPQNNLPTEQLLEVNSEIFRDRGGIT